MPLHAGRCGPQFYSEKFTHLDALLDRESSDASLIVKFLQLYHDFVKVNFYNKNTSTRLAQGYRDVAAPGAGGWIRSRKVSAR